jgi:hypothetical protein
VALHPQRHANRGKKAKIPKNTTQIYNKRISSGDDDKFDMPFTGMLRTYAAMFKPLSDMLVCADLERPAPSFEGGYTKWKKGVEENTEDWFQLAEMDLTEGEEEALEVASQIGHGILEKFLSHSSATGWSSQTTDERLAHVEHILSAPSAAQRTPEWYVQGRTILTASEFSNLFGSPRAFRVLAQQKATPLDGMTQHTNRLACMTCEMGPFDWGIRFEPVVKQILERKWGVKIRESGRIIHPTKPKLAASPDGLIVQAMDPKRIGRLLEIKCPITRDIGNNIPFEYWCQMQIQMEVTGIDECEYVEVKLDSPTAKQPDISGSTPDGHVWLFQDSSSCIMYYAYTEHEKDTYADKGYELIETIPWRLIRLYTKTVTRDRAWFQSTNDIQNTFWELVEKVKRGEVPPLEPVVKKGASSTLVKVIKEPVCLMLDDDIGPHKSESPLGQETYAGEGVVLASAGVETLATGSTL